MSIYAVATLLGIYEVVEAILRYLITNYLVVRGDDRTTGSRCTSHGPYLLKFKQEEVVFAAIDDSKVSIVGVYDLVVTISEEEEAYFALGSVALCCSLNTINFVSESVEQGVVDVDQAIITL